MRVLLISGNTLIRPYPVYPLGLDYVAGAIRDAHAVRIVDMNRTDRAGLAAEIEAFAPDVVGISIRNVDNTDLTAPEGYLSIYADLAAAVRDATAAPLVLGGSGFSLFPRHFMRALSADYGVVGDGERLADLLGALADGGSPAIPGIITRKGGSETPHIPETYGGRRHFDPDSAHLDFYLKKGGMLNLQTRRGCRYRCVYCTYPHIEGRRMRRVDPAVAADMAVRLERAGARYLFIADSTFNADPDHSLAVADAFKKAGLTIPWGGFFAPMRAAPDYYARMADAGLRHVEFGTDALSDHTLRSYGKPFSVAEVFSAHDRAVAAGLNVAHYMLFGGPGEGPETVAETLFNVDKLDRTVLFFFAGMRVYPNTPLHGIAAREGRLAAGGDLTEPFFYRPEGIDHAAIMDRIQERAAGRPNWIVGAGGETSARILTRMYEKGYTGPLWEYLIR